LFLLQISELNAALLPENMTFDPSVMKPITARKANTSFFETFASNISPKPLLQETICCS